MGEDEEEGDLLIVEFLLYEEGGGGASPLYSHPPFLTWTPPFISFSFFPFTYIFYGPKMGQVVLSTQSLNNKICSRYYIRLNSKIIGWRWKTWVGDHDRKTR